MALEVVRVGIVCAAAMIPFGACVELVQTLVPGRSAEIPDV
jgi:VanZ family protein